MCVYSFDKLIHVTDWFELKPGEERELKSIETGPAGGLRAHCRGVRPTAARAHLVGADGISSYSLTWTGAGFRGENLSPGSYTLKAYGRGAFAFQRSVEVVAGAECQVDIEFLNAVTRPLQMWIDDTNGEWQSLHLEVRDTSGRLCWKLEQGYLASLLKPYTQRVTLPVGSYTLETRFDDRAARRFYFEIVESTSQQEPLRFELR